MREQRAKFTENRRASGPSSLTVARRRFAMLDQKGTVVLIAVSVAIWLLDQVSGGFLSQWLAYNSALLPTQPWRIVTVLFVHSGVFHILFNMLALFIFGRMLENMLGTWRFLALYFISGIAGSMLVTFLAPGTWVVGASGAIFGLFAAFFVLQRSLGNNAVQLLVIIGLNLVIGFLPGTNISWQAHVGGVLAGFVTGFVFSRTRNVRQRGLQMTLLALEAVVAIALCFVGYAVTTG
ncbi:rhomboid family intramembrane serine protease [Curtobacterium sp. MCLR17_032]|uniref:rhomboid family intramembrane serine protease n=1 Tax=Curtobacterium sp. MCLR17_032 TaxID=2175650 RepID=UPI0021AC7622|nr:rhomboid family intramembrane serine protease [Curtobacterium sp. MCLR17_032]WIE61564.1 rhomboid family intramembrane serine protease [Curtobacterium sp. MCLR17_032]